MLFEYFSCAKLGTFTIESIKNVNRFYLPLIKTSGFAFYTYLLFHSNNVQNFSFAEVSLFLKLPKPEIKAALHRLEACGLIKTFTSTKAQHVVLQLALPYDFKNFFANPLLVKLLKNSLGNNNFQQLIATWGQIKAPLSNDYAEVSQSIFSVYKKELENSNVPGTKLNLLSNEAIKNLSLTAATEQLSPEKFYAYLCQAVAPQYLSNWKQQFIKHFSFVSLNLIINYTFWKLKEVPYAFLQKIATDLVTKKIISIEKVEAHFQKIMKTAKHLANFENKTSKYENLYSN